MAYIMTFKNANSQTCVVSISGGTGTLTPSANPVTLEEDDDDDLFKPVRSVSGNISFMDDGTVLPSLMPTSPTQRTVTITVDKTIIFFGYLKCEVYSQDLYAGMTEVTIPVVDIFGVMDGIEVASLFTDQDEAFGMKTVSVLLDAFFDPLDEEYGLVYPTGNTSMDAEILLKNFVETSEDKSGNVTYDSSKILEVFEEICKYFGWQAHAQGHDIYLTQIDVTQTYTDNNTAASIPLDSDLFRTTDHDTNYQPPRNKVIVTGSVGDYPESLLQLSLKDQAVPTGLKNTAYDENVCTEKKWAGDSYTAVIPTTPQYVLNLLKSGTSFTGASFESVGFNSMSLTDYVVFNLKSSSGYNPYFSIHTKEKFYIRGGDNFKLGLKATFKFASDIASELNYTPNNTCSGWFKLRIGDYYYNGSGWQTTECRFNASISPKNGVVYINTSIPQDTYYKFDSYTGMYIDIPTDMMGDIYFSVESLNSNDSNVNIFALSALELKHLRAIPYIGAPTDDDENEYAYNYNNGAPEEYTYNMKLTTPVGVESGYGCVYPLDEGTQYWDGHTKIQEMWMLDRLKSIYSQTREIREVTLNYDKTVRPIDLYNDETGVYGVLSRSINLYEGTMKLKLIELP